MASPPGGGDQGDSRDPILEIAAKLLTDFIYERICRYWGSNTVTRQQLGGEELCDPRLKDISDCLQQIGDELDGNANFQELINTQPLILTSEMFIEVARELFSDGKFNWGRVVALFYFACRLVIKALKRKIHDIIRTIITWTMDYLREHMANWIREQGGWEGIRSYVCTPTWQMLAVFLAGLVTAAFVICKK
ncbi:apoptosis regulator BAX-like [Melanotaenia boesemani]|uniref:apoptosis regulator BAX-like n=1 Tax=Melanotaenia boesemani TaxID=1250792 RepID=UPI001C03EF88|nr:apoptosis regulator BAX-like [Melanotaenia boesemani]